MRLGSRQTDSGLGYNIGEVRERIGVPPARTFTLSDKENIMDYSTFKALTPSICSQEVWERFCKQISLSDSGCWLWTGYTLPTGYGQFFSKGLNKLPHRIAYLAVHGSLPKELVLDHICRTRNCVNPAHLEPVTIGENVMRGETLAAQNAAKECCPYGHEYSEENTYFCKRGHRHCKACFYRRNKERQGRLNTERERDAQEIARLQAVVEKQREGVSAIVNRYDDTKDWMVTTPTGSVIKLSEVFGSCAEHLRSLK
jgi:hypothetical protein